MNWDELLNFLVFLLFVVDSGLGALVGRRNVVRHGIVDIVGNLIKPLTKVAGVEGVYLTRKNGDNKWRSAKGKSHLEEN